MTRPAGNTAHTATHTAGAITTRPAGNAATHTAAHTAGDAIRNTDLPAALHPRLPQTDAQREEHRQAFARRLDAALIGLGLGATEEEQRIHAHHIITAWETRQKCAACTKEDDALGCAAFTIDRDENGDLRGSYAYCPRHYRAAARRRQRKLFGDTFLGDRFRTRTFRSFEPTEGTRDAYHACLTLAQEFTPGMRGILLLGRSGTGKTHLAGALVAALARQGHRAILLTTTRLLDLLRARLDRPADITALKDALIHADLLVLDDLGSEQTSEWSREQLLLILDERCEGGRTTAATSLHTIDTLTKRLGERIVGRLLEMTDTYPITAPNRRIRGGAT